MSQPTIWISDEDREAYGGKMSAFEYVRLRFEQEHGLVFTAAEIELGRMFLFELGRKPGCPATAARVTYIGPPMPTNLVKA